MSCVWNPGMTVPLAPASHAALQRHTGLQPKFHKMTGHLSLPVQGFIQCCSYVQGFTMLLSTRMQTLHRCFYADVFNVQTVFQAKETVSSRWQLIVIDNLRVR